MSTAVLLHQLAQLRRDHPVVFVLVLVPIVTMVANWGIYFFTSPRWNQILLSNPRLAGLLKLLKSAGLDPAGILKSLYMVLTGRVWTEPKPTEAEELAVNKLAVKKRIEALKAESKVIVSPPSGKGPPKP